MFNILDTFCKAGYNKIKEEAVRRIAPRAATVLEAFQQADTKEKNALLRSVIDRIIYHKTQPTPHGGNPLELLELDVYPIKDKKIGLSVDSP